MASHGIRDRVAIIGMGCTKFAERFEASADDMLRESTAEALESAGLDPRTGHDAIDAYWLGTAQTGMSGITLARPLELTGKPVTRVENFCATGSEALRQAAYAVASGAYDTAMAVGVEKVKDSGYAGLNAFPVPGDGTDRRCDVLDGGAGVRAQVRRAGRRDPHRAGPDRVQEPLQRRA
jgi:acetyl-CoA C-acetyltransferase